MRHRVGGRKLGLPSDQRKALLRSLVSSILWNDQITTTESRAKEAVRIVDRIITLAKRDDIHSRRLVQKMIFEQNLPFRGQDRPRHGDPRRGHSLMRRIFEEVGPWYRDVRGGYTRIIRIGPRRGDAAMMVRVELTKGVSLAQRPTPKKSSRQSSATGASAAGSAVSSPVLPETGGNAVQKALEASEPA